jgi:hypothetical protein
VADIYTPIVYVDGSGGGTPLSASNLNHTEEGIDDLDSVVQNIADDVDAIRAGLESHSAVRKGTTADRALFAAVETDQFWDTDLDKLLTYIDGKWQQADGTDVTTAGGTNAPTNFAIEVVDGGTIGQLDMTWTAPAAIDGDDTYKLYEVQSPTGVSGATALTGTSTSRTPNTARTYEYWVTALVDGVESAASNHAFGTLPYVAGGGGGSGSGSPSALLNINGLGSATGGWWNLGVGYDSGHVNISPNDLKTFSQVPYYYINGSKVHFQTDCAGARTTKNTHYPRSELREFSNATTQASWNASSGRHQMSAYQTVTALHVSFKPELCIFQIHDAADDTLQVIAKAPDGSTTMSWVLKVGGTQVATLATGVALGDRHQLHADVNNGTLTFKYDGVTKYTGSFTGSGQYFKIGAYLQANNRDQANSATDYMSCEVDTLVVSHS